MQDINNSLTESKISTNSNGFNQQVELSYFEKRVGKPIFKIVDNNLQICFNTNAILLAIGYQIIQDSILTNKISQLIREIKNEKILFRINENFPKDYSNFHHQETLRSILISTLYKISTLSQQKCLLSKEQIQQLIITVLNFHPISEVSLCCFIRSKALYYLTENIQNYEYDILGNQQWLLSNYNSDLRHLPLRIISEAFNIYFTLIFRQHKQQYYSFSTQLQNKKKNLKIKVQKKQKCIIELQSQSLIPRNKIRQTVLRKYDQDKLFRVSSSRLRHIPKIMPFRQSLIPSDKHDKHLLNQTQRQDQLSKRTDSITHNQNSCLKCGNFKKSKFCECRKKSLPKTKEIKVEKQKQAIKYNYLAATPLGNLDLNIKKCKKCKLIKNLFLMDCYCGQCIGRFNIKRCKSCNQLFQNACQRCSFLICKVQ